MLAESMQMQAQATILISNSIDMMVKNEMRQTKVLELIYERLTNSDT